MREGLPVGFRPGNEHGLVLYDYGASPCARRCRITMIEKGLCWDTQLIDLSRLEQRSPAYLAINPNGFVPALAHGERVIFESNVITEYLDDLFPESPLYPDDPFELAQVKMWQSAELAMAKDYRPLMYQRVMGPTLRLTRTLDQALAAARRSTTSDADLAWESRVWSLEVLTPDEEVAYEDRLIRWLELLERHLEGREFLVGDRFTQADVSVFPRVMMLPFVWVRIDPTRFPNVTRWAARLGKRPSFAKTLSQQDQALQRLSRTPIPRWLSRTLEKPDAERTSFERIGLSLLRKLFEQAVGSEDEQAATRPPRAIRKPTNGAKPPTRVAARAHRPTSTQIAPITLYDYPASPHGRRIRILLLEKGLSWTTAWIDLERMAHKAPLFLAINSDGEIPALRHGDRLLHDSQTIAEYLDQVFSTGASLYPADAFDRARVRMWLALEAGTHKELRPLFHLHVIRPALLARGVTAERIDEFVTPGIHPSHRQWLLDTLAGRPRFDSSEELARSIVRAKLDVLELHLQDRDFLVGDALSMADAAWFTRLDQLPTLGIPFDEERHPNLVRWHRGLARRPSISASAEAR